MTWVLDAPGSTIDFAAEHRLFASTVRGEFREFEAEVTFEPRDIPRSHVSARIVTASLATGNAGRDHDLLSPRFLDAAAFPLITFASSDVAQMGPAGLWVRGDLTIRGTTREVTLSGEYTAPAGEEGAAAILCTLRVSIDRRDFLDISPLAGGPLIGNAIEITIHARLVETGTAPSER